VVIIEYIYQSLFLEAEDNILLLFKNNFHKF
jgi:hypothetical protein